MFGDIAPGKYRIPFNTILNLYTDLKWKIPQPPYPQGLLENEKHLEGVLADYWREREEASNTGAERS